MSYEFTLWVRSGTSVAEDWANAVYEAGGDDTLVGCHSGQDYIRFDRARPPSMKQSAPLSALSIKLEAK